MGIVIDTNVIIRHEKAQRAIPYERFGPKEDCFLSAKTISELEVGILLAASQVRRQHRKMVVDTLLAGLQVLSFTRDIALIHAQVQVGLRHAGSMIGTHDLIIAATALHHGHRVLTAVSGELERDAGLQVVRWADP